MELFTSEEFSLFGGDLLFPPAAHLADEGLATAPQDGLKITPPSVPGLQADEILGHDVPSNKQVSGK